MIYKFWGVRGSLPTPENPQARYDNIMDLLKQFQASQHQRVTEFASQMPRAVFEGFGGHTSCFEIQQASKKLIIDCGSGIKELGLEIMRGPASSGQDEIHILMTHFHWDHLIGLPFFSPIFIPKNRIHFYAVQEELEQTIRLLFSKPFFPVPFENLGAEIYFHQLEPRQKTVINGFEVTPYQLDHPDPCWGFAIEKLGKKIAHCVDTEGVRISREDLAKDLPLYQSADLMIFDAQYTLLEVIEKMNWGHGVAGLGLDIAMREGIKNVAFVHHDPYAGIEKILEAVEQTKKYYNHRIKESAELNLGLSPVNWFFARDGLSFEI